MNLSSGGGSGGTGGIETITWTPSAPTKDDIITFTVNKADNVRLHWGVNTWSSPDQIYWPSESMEASGAIQSPFTLSDSKRVLQIGPFNGSQNVTSVNFVLYYPDSDSWDNNNENNYRIDITEATSNEYKEVEKSYTLHQNYPNPFNPSTRISFELPAASYSRLFVSDLLGRTVADLVNGNLSQGVHILEFDASKLSSGMYIYRLETSFGVLTQKMTLLK